MALRQTYSSLCSLSSLTRDVAAISMSKISEKPCTQLPSSLPERHRMFTDFCPGSLPNPERAAGFSASADEAGEGVLGFASQMKPKLLKQRFAGR